MSHTVRGISEGSVLQSEPLHVLSKKIISSIDKFFKEGSDRLTSAKTDGYKEEQWIEGYWITDWGGPAILFLIYPFASYNPDTSKDKDSSNYTGKSGGYFTTIDQGGEIGVMGKIVLHLDKYIPPVGIFDPYGGQDIRDDKRRKEIYKNYKRDLYQFAYHEAQHAVKRFIHGWSGRPSVGTQYQKYYKKAPGDQSLSKYSEIGDEWESILSQIMSEVQSTIRFDKGRPEQLKTLTKTLITSPSFRRLVIGMLDGEKIGADATRGDEKVKKFFQVFWSGGKSRFLVNVFDPWNPEFFKYIQQKYQKVFKTMVKKLVEWWRDTYPKKSFRTPLGEIINKNEILYLGWVNRNNLKVIGFDVQSGESETHHNYLMGLPPEWRGQSDRNLVRWRYRKDMNVVYWWEMSEPTDEEKKAVEDWIESNLQSRRPGHRIITTGGNQMNDPNFLKSHGEDECVSEDNQAPYGGCGGGGPVQPSHLDIDRVIDDLKRDLNEDMTYAQLMGISDPDRIKRAKTVSPKSLRVRSIDEYEAWTFSYKSNPSNSVRSGGISPRWQGYVKFLKEEVKSGEDAKNINCHVDCTCPDYKYRWAYNNASVNAGKIGSDSWNKCINKSPRTNLGQGMCKHLIALEGFLRTKIVGSKTSSPGYKPTGKKPNIFESVNLFEQFNQFVKSHPEFDVAYDDDEKHDSLSELLITDEELRLIEESKFYENKSWMVYEGTDKISTIFEDGSQLSFDLNYRGNLGENKDKWRTKAARTWKKMAMEIHKDVQLTEVGNTIETPWKQCFEQALKSKEMKEFQKGNDYSPVFDPVNFTPGG